MEYVFVGIGIVVGVAGCMFLDVDKFSNIFAKKEEEIDDKEEHNEGK